MTDELLARAVESCALDADAFNHREHVRLAWYYLEEGPLLGAMARFSAAIRRFAAHHGASSRYHETITIAYLLMIAERRRGERDFEVFAAHNRDLLEDGRALLGRFYTPDTLASEQARDRFVLPDA